MKKPKFLEVNAHADKTIRFGQKREAVTLKSIGATSTPRSGAGRIKGDGRKKIGQRELHIEIKATNKKGFRVSDKIMDKLREEAGHARHPILIVDMVANEKYGTRVAYVVCPINTFIQLTNLEVNTQCPPKKKSRKR